MTLRKALMTGLPLRRRTKSKWNTVNYVGLPYEAPYSVCTTKYKGVKGWLCPDYLLSSLVLKKEDIIAKDWEVKNG